MKSIRSEATGFVQREDYLFDIFRENMIQDGSGQGAFLCGIPTKDDETERFSS